MAEIGKLNSLFKQCVIYLNQVLLDQIKFYEDANSRRIHIDLQKHLDSGRLVVIKSPAIDKIQNIQVKLEPLEKIIHEGELEAITHISENRNFIFCTGDLPAIQAMAFLGLSKNGISLERLMGKFKNMEVQYTEEFFKKYIKFGKQQRIQFGDI
jgi:hypothetical protein